MIESPHRRETLDHLDNARRDITALSGSNDSGTCMLGSGSVGYNEWDSGCRPA